MARAVWIVFLLLALATETVGASDIRRVLVVNSYGSDYEPFAQFVAKFRRELSARSSTPIDFYEVSFAAARFEDGQPDRPFVGYIDSLFAERRLDLAVVVGAPAAGFVQRYRAELFPGTPVLLTAVEERRLSDFPLTPNDAPVAFRLDRSLIFANILKLLPGTKHIAVITGNSPNNKSWQETITRELQSYSKEIELIWLNDASFGKVLDRVSELPANTAVYLGPTAVSSTQLPHEAESVLAAVHARANAPLFGAFDAYLGQGIVGGPLIPLADLAREAAVASVRILDGEKPAQMKPILLELGTPVFDWRELQRWSISEANLPSASIVQFREQTIWQKYAWYFVLIAAVCAIETACIVALLVNRRRLERANAERQQAEKEAVELSGRLINAQEEERARLARELHDDITQRLAVLAIDVGREERSWQSSAAGAAMRKTRDGLARLSEDVHALSYRLHPSILRDLGLQEAVKSECEQFSRTCPTLLEARVDDIPKNLPQDVGLCVFRIIQEALRNIARHAHAQLAKIDFQCRDSELQLTISDDGQGFNSAVYPSKSSLGHASMRQRISLLRGRIAIESSVGRGTTIRVWVPIEEGSYEQAAHFTGRRPPHRQRRLEKTT